MNDLTCPFCGAKLTSRSLKCPACGQSLPAETLRAYGREAQAEFDTAWNAQKPPLASYKSEEASEEPYGTYSAYEPYDPSDYKPFSGGRRCPYCFTSLPARCKNCPGCGRELPLETLDNMSDEATTALEDAVIMPPVEEEKPRIEHPTTIEELKLYCEQHSMPLIKMRFFIGTDYQQPRAFGIYRDGDTFIVYKNKDNGQRAIRYRGPDEAFAVNELYQKLLSECHLRGIYLDGKPAADKAAPVRRRPSAAEKRRSRVLWIGAFILIAALLISMFVYDRSTHGYYRVNDTLYYRDNSRWYVYSDYDWMPYYGVMYDWDDYYLGYGYEDDYGGYDVEDSGIWEDDHPATDSSDDDSWDYDSWDSSDTDWGSDW